MGTEEDEEENVSPEPGSEQKYPGILLESRERTKVSESVCRAVSLETGRRRLGAELRRVQTKDGGQLLKEVRGGQIHAHLHTDRRARHTRNTHIYTRSL